MLSPYLLFTDKKFTVNYLLPWNKIFCLNLGINLRKDLIGIIIIYFKFQWTRIEQMMFSTKEYSLYFMCFHIFFPSKFLIIFIQNFFSNSYKMQCRCQWFTSQWTLLRRPLRVAAAAITGGRTWIPKSFIRLSSYLLCTSSFFFFLLLLKTVPLPKSLIQETESQFLLFIQSVHLYPSESSFAHIAAESAEIQDRWFKKIFTMAFPTLLSFFWIHSTILTRDENLRK